MATLSPAIKYSGKYAPFFLSQMLYALEDCTVYELESKALTTISSTKMYLQNGRCLILFKSFKGNSTCKMSAMCRCHPAASRKVKGGNSMHQIGSGFCMLLLLLYLTASLHFMSNTALPACEIFWCSVLRPRLTGLRLFQKQLQLWLLRWSGFSGRVGAVLENV